MEKNNKRVLNKYLYLKAWPANDIVADMQQVLGDNAWSQAQYTDRLLNPSEAGSLLKMCVILDTLWRYVLMTNVKSRYTVKFCHKN